LNEEDPSHCTGTDHSLEAVAVDCSFAYTETSTIPLNSSINEVDSDCKNSNEDMKKDISSGKKKKKADFVLLILAGLTGGSGEGYVLDLVNSANDIGAVDDVPYSLPSYLPFICFE
jgi:hypothetical protein